jgi:hypothetical protein
MEKDKKVIFIGGSSYSGSTMLDMMLANHPEGFSAGEIHALFHPYRPHHFDPECGCGEPDCTFWMRVKKGGKKNIYKSIFSILPEVSLIVDSSKDPWWIRQQSEYLKQHDIQAYNLLIWKDPLAFAHSMLKRNRKGWKKAWRNYYRLYLSIISHYVPVSYQELAKKPDQTLQKVCNKVDIPYHQSQKYFWNKKHHTLFGNNSAKVHLSQAESPQIIDEATANKHSSQHRSIYFDTGYKSLPSETRQEAENDYYLKSIHAALSKNTSYNLTKIQYSGLEVQIKKFAWSLKKSFGRILGQHWRLF